MPAICFGYPMPSCLYSAPYVRVVAVASRRSIRGSGGFPAGQRLITQEVNRRRYGIRGLTGECDFNHTLSAKVTGQCVCLSIRKRRPVMEGKESDAGQWTSTQAYVLSVICL